MYDYGECHACGEAMRERRISQDVWVKRKLVVIEGVPAGVCPQCGEKVVRADVGRTVMDLLGRLKRLGRTWTISVPVVRFVKDVA